MKQYVALNQIRALRSVCAPVRSGVLPSAVKPGRFSRVPEEDRKCPLRVVWMRLNDICLLCICLEPDQSDIF